MSGEPVTLDGSGLREEIAALEAELDLLETKAESCRRTTQIARIAAGAGAVLLALGFWRSDPTVLVSGIAAVLGGLAFAGSTEATRRKVLERIEAVETLRSDTIDGLGVAALAPEPRGGVVVPFRR